MQRSGQRQNALKRSLKSLLLDGHPDCPRHFRKELRSNTRLAADFFWKTGCDRRIERPIIHTSFNPRLSLEYRQLQARHFKEYTLPANCSVFESMLLAYKAYTRRTTSVTLRDLASIRNVEKKLRPVVVRQVKAHADRYGDIPVPVAYNKQFRLYPEKEYWQYYAMLMSHHAVASEREVAALADVSGCAIHIYKRTKPSVYTLMNVYNPLKKEKRYVPLLRFLKKRVAGQDHYDVLVPAVVAKYHGQFWNFVSRDLLHSARKPPRRARVQSTLLPPPSMPAAVAHGGSGAALNFISSPGVLPEPPASDPHSATSIKELVGSGGGGSVHVSNAKSPREKSAPKSAPRRNNNNNNKKGGGGLFRSNSANVNSLEAKLKLTTNS